MVVIMRAAIFIEPDGILTRIRAANLGGGTGVHEMILEAAESLKILKEADFLLIATGNEGHLPPKGFRRADLDRLHEDLRRAFPLDDVLACRHDAADECPCRKPRPGLILEAAFKWHLELDRCFVIGNRWQDAEAARHAGCVSTLINSPWIGKGHRDYVLPDLSAVARKILEVKELEPVLLP